MTGQVGHSISTLEGLKEVEVGVGLTLAGSSLGFRVGGYSCPRPAIPELGWGWGGGAGAGCDSLLPPQCSSPVTWCWHPCLATWVTGTIGSISCAGALPSGPW